MNKIAVSIRNRLSLRRPQEVSLNILADLADKLTLQKNADLTGELEKVKSAYPICTDFERNFPSLCFALATGVGKTRLMGAFITYLYLTKGMKHFFVLAPNLTIYNKLMADFKDSTNPKYVFHGIGEFATVRPRVITGEDYQYASQQAIFDSEVQINVFNISKINAETKGESSRASNGFPNIWAIPISTTWPIWTTWSCSWMNPIITGRTGGWRSSTN